MIATVIVAAFGEVVTFEFLSFDDGLHVTDNPHFHPLTLRSLGELWRQPYEQLYIPVSYTFFAAEVWLSRIIDPAGPLHPAIFHLSDLLLHVACVLLVYRLLVRATRNRGAAAIGSLVFGLHPLQTESVAWISETRGLLSALLSLVAVSEYLRFAEPAEGKSRLDDRARYLHYALACAALLLALLSKPSAASAVLIAGILDRAMLGRPLKEIAIALTPWALLVAIVTAVTSHQQAVDLIATRTPLWVRPLVAGDALAFYIIKLVAPLGLAMHYDHGIEAVLMSSTLPVAWLLPCGLIVALALVPRRQTWLTAAALFIAGILPVAGFIPFLFQQHSTVADRYVYLAMLGPAWAVAQLLAWRWTRPTIVLSAAALCCLATISFLQASYWQNNERLYEHALRVNPRSYLAHGNLGALLVDQRRIDEAIEHLRLAMEANPNDPNAKTNMGCAQAEKGDSDAAIASFRDALRVKPDLAKARANLATALFLQGRVREALPHFRAAGAQAQINPTVVNEVAWMLATDPDPQFRDGPLAVQFAERAIKLVGENEPNSLDTLAAAYAEAGRFVDARETELKALRLVESLGDTKTTGLIKGRLDAFQQNRPLRVVPAHPSPKP